MVVAWIGFGGAVIAAVISAVVAVRQDALALRQTHLQHELGERLARVQSDLDTERHMREAMIDRSLAAEDVLTRYREPLAAAAFELQSRIYNILCLGFFGKYANRDGRAEDAVTTTLFRMAQYFGWTEILRRDIQYLSFPEAEETRGVAQLQADIAKCFLTDRYGPELMIWTDEQRAIGEHMIVDEHNRVLCMGYARFRERHDEMLWQLCDRLRADVTNPVVHARLRDAQHLLCELVEKLDSRRVRYTRDLERA
jgi:hypothetical protein